MAIFPYGNLLSEFFRRINSAHQSQTYAGHNRRTTVINAANRRFAANNGFEAPGTTIIYPSKKSLHGMIIIAVDTSGSISDDKMETGRIVGEILRMTVTYNCWEDRDVEIIYCGTRLRKDGPFKASSAELDAYIEKIKKNGIKASNCDTDLLPIWKNIIRESESANGYPFGLVFVTGAETLNDDKIVELYKSGEFQVTTMIICPEGKSLSESFIELSDENSSFEIGVI